MKRLNLTVAAVALLFSFATLVHAQDKHGGMHKDGPKWNPNAGFLGVLVAPVDDDAAERLKLESHAGVLVKEPVADSPAAKAGLMADDVILKIDGADVADVQAFIEMMSKTRPQQSMKFTVNRAGSMQDINVVLGTRPAEPPNTKEDDKKDKDGDKDGDKKEDGK